MLEQPTLDALQIGTVADIELVRAVEHAEVLVDAIFLDEGVSAAPADLLPLKVWATARVCISAT